MPFLRIITFGCKVNQYESAMMAESLAGLAFVPASGGDPLDLVLVNTCTVTARADQQARQTIRRLAREHPGVPLWVTGCYAQRAPEAVAALPGVAMVFGNPEKVRVADLAAGGSPRSGPLIRVRSFSGQEPFITGCEVSRFPGHTRAWLKIQDGCSHACTYCIVPAVRGPARSLPWEKVPASLENLADKGFQEIVLTGVDLGQYGRDLYPPASLADLLRRLAHKTWPFRLRLSSLEPQGLTGELLAALAGLPNLCPHFHLPLQSGSAGVLQAMGRPYGPDHFRDMVQELFRRFPEAALGLDILVGFPGESEGDFEATRRLVEALPVAYLHVFPFSPRPGTPAQAMAGLSGAEIRRRTHIMRRLGAEKKKAFYHRHLGREAEVLVEGPMPGRPGWLKGLSANYLRVLLPGPPSWRNRRLKVRFSALKDEVLVGRALSSPLGPESY